MESNNFDKYIHKKLEDRRLPPSQETWSKLSEKLETTNKSKNKSFWMLGVAASVIGILFVTFQFLNTKEVKPVIVDAATMINNNTQVVVEEAKDSKAIIIDEQVKEEQKKFFIKEKSIIPINNSPIVVVKKDEIQNKMEDVLKFEKVSQEILAFETQKVQDIVAKVNSLKNNNEEVSDADIVALLAQAQKEIKLNRLVNETTSVVDANLLLESVETGLDKSFRSKVFEAIKASYGTVKSAVAQRNN